MIDKAGEVSVASSTGRWPGLGDRPTDTLGDGGAKIPWYVEVIGLMEEQEIWYNG